MVKKAGIILISLCMAGVMITGCQSSGNGGEAGTAAPAEKKTELSDSDKNLDKIRKAYADFYASPLRETKLKSIIKYKKGRKTKNTDTTIIDKEQQKVFFKSKTKISGAKEKEENGTKKYKNFYTVEDGKDYKYAYRKEVKNDDDYFEILDNKVWYKVELPGEKEEDFYDSTFSSFAENQNVTFLEDTEDCKYRNIVITENGHKNIDGIDTIEYNVSYEISLPNYKDTSREQLIKDNEWDEDVIDKIDGMSDFLDDYVEYYNKKAAEGREFHSVTMDPVYLNAETGELVQTSTDGYVETQEASDFGLYRNKYYQYQYYSESQGEETAEKMVNDENFGEGRSEYMVTSRKDTTTYYTGDACDDMPALPDKVVEMSWKEYDDGFYDAEY